MNKWIKVKKRRSDNKPPQRTSVEHWQTDCCVTVSIFVNCLLFLLGVRGPKKKLGNIKQFCCEWKPRKEKRGVNLPPCVCLFYYVCDDDSCSPLQSEVKGKSPELNSQLQKKNKKKTAKCVRMSLLASTLTTLKSLRKKIHKNQDCFSTNSHPKTAPLTCCLLSVMDCAQPIITSYVFKCCWYCWSSSLILQLFCGLFSGFVSFCKCRKVLFCVK